MNILIVGAGGFLGKMLLRQLAEDKQITVYAITSKTKQYEYLKEKYANVVILPQDSIYNTKLFFSETDILINCAFPRGVKGQLFASGMKYITDTLKASVRWGVGGVINISSQSVYSTRRSKPASESSALELESTYAVGKYASELLTEAICTPNTMFTNIRMASLIGPEFDQRVTNKLVDTALRSSKLSIEAGNQKFGFLDITDAVAGILCILKMPKAKWKPVYNLGSDYAYSLSEIGNSVAAVLEKQLGKKTRIEEKTSTAVFNTALDCSLLKTESGYKQQISLEESIDRIVRQKVEETVL